MVKSDPWYAPDKVAERSRVTRERMERAIEAGIMGGVIGGILATSHNI